MAGSGYTAAAGAVLRDSTKLPATGPAQWRSTHSTARAACARSCGSAIVPSCVSRSDSASIMPKLYCGPWPFITSGSTSSLILAMVLPLSVQVRD